MKQRKAFLHSEGDAWFARNHARVTARKLPDQDPLLKEIINFVCFESHKATKVLEIGCGEASRLEFLKNNLNADCYGIEPSAAAVAVANSRGINVHQGTAEVLPFDNLTFDCVIFGFCLYLCDREDLFRIASEADRVLRSPGWLVIADFYSAEPRANDYRHLAGMLSYKMDYRTLFNWHPAYVNMSHRIFDHGEIVNNRSTVTDNPGEWIAVSVMRKYQREFN